MLQRDQPAMVVGLAFFVCAAGFLRLDASLLGWLSSCSCRWRNHRAMRMVLARSETGQSGYLQAIQGLAAGKEATARSETGQSGYLQDRLSLVRYDEQRREWRATYIGRTALFMPLARMRESITGSQPAGDNHAALLALLAQGHLGPVIRRAVARMPVEQLHQLVLCLSLQEGGAAAIRYLQPALPQLLRPTAASYAALADEAARPSDLQRWITVLGEWEESGGGVALEIGQALTSARQALMSYEHTRTLDAALRDLRHLIQALYGIVVLDKLESQPNYLARSEISHGGEGNLAWSERHPDSSPRSPRRPVEGACQSDWDELLPMGWPVALFMHVESHGRKLRHHKNDPFF